MNEFDIKTMEPAAFGQLAEQVYEGTGGYDERTRNHVFTRLVRVGSAAGRTSVIRAVHDGEVGTQFVALPKTDRVVMDPISQGV